MRTVRDAVALAVLLAAIPLAAAAAGPTNWPAWRGEGMTGVADGADLPVTFSETRNLRWKVEVPGHGESTPVIWGDRLFLLAATPAPDGGPTDGPAEGMFGVRKPGAARAFEVLCFDRQTGKTLWRKAVRTEVPHEGHHRDHGFASYSPVTDGRHVWASFGSRGVHCLTMDGEIRWSRDLGRLRMRMSFGEGSSPALTPKAVIVLVDHEGDSFLVALDRETGKDLWRKSREETSSWTTPLVVEHGGRRQIIVNGANRTRSYDAQTGEAIWQCAGQTGNVIPTPVAGHGLVFCASGFRGNAILAIELGRTGELTGTDAIRWQAKERTPYVSSPTLYGKRIYCFDGTRANLTCRDALTGRVLYTVPAMADIKNVYASPLAVDGRLYFAGREGTVAVVKDGDTFELLAVNKFSEGFDASPAAAGRDLYLRGEKHLYCFRKSQGSGPQPGSD